MGGLTKDEMLAHINNYLICVDPETLVAVYNLQAQVGTCIKTVAVNRIEEVVDVILNNLSSIDDQVLSEIYNLINWD